MLKNRLQEEDLNSLILEGIYSHLPISILRIDTQGNLLDTKGSRCKKFLSYFRNSKEGTDKTGQDCSDLGNINIFQRDRKIYNHIEPVFQEKKSVFFEYSVQEKNTTHYYENYAFLVSSARTEPPQNQAIIISIDITQDVISKQTLNRKNSELKAIFDAIPDVYFRLDTSGIVLDYKSASISQLYIPEDLFVGKLISNFLPSHLSTKVNESLDIVNHSKKLHTLEYNIPMGNTKRYFEARFFPFYEDEIIVIIREITDRVTYQEKIIEKERLLLETQKIAKVFSFFWDLENHVVSYTDEFYNMMGLKPDEVEQSPDSFIEFIHPEDREMVTMEVQNCLQENTHFYVEYRILLPNQKIIYMLSEGKIKFNKEGKPTQLLGLSQDISIRKEYEIELLTQKRELERLLNNIEGIVSHQTTEVVLAKEKAEQASQAKTFFLANMSHELKTPIHAIMSFAELGKDKVAKMDRERIEEYFSIIYESGRKLYNLMGNILDISKIDSGQEHFDFQEANLHELTKDVVRELDGLLKQKEIELKVEKPTFETKLEMDVSKISQVIRNLINNAIKFSPGKSTIQIQFIEGSYVFPNKEKNERGIGFKIRDRGPGIHEEEKEKIFEKFMQGQGMKAGMGGTGLGLAICKEIISFHNGIIYADNHPQGGAEFVFLVPFVQTS